MWQYITFRWSEKPNRYQSQWRDTAPASPSRYRYCPHTQETGWHSHEVHCCAPQTVAQGSNAIHLQLSVVFVARTSSPAVSPRQAMIPCWVPVMYANCTCAAWGDPCACQHQTGETKLQKEGRGDAAGRAARLKQSRQWQRLTCCPPGWWSCTSPS